jgi:hypothetical protein
MKKASTSMRGAGLSLAVCATRRVHSTWPRLAMTTPDPHSRPVAVKSTASLATRSQVPKKDGRQADTSPAGVNDLG